MKLYLILGAVVLIGLAAFLFFEKKEEKLSSSQFMIFKEKFGKTYSNDMETYRQAVFYENLKKIQQHNKSNSSYTMQVNQFADLTADEFKRIYLGTTPSFYQGNKKTSRLFGAPKQVDWSKKGAVTDIKDQGQCGSCWAFSTTGCLEGVNVIDDKKTLTAFSEQQLVDCSGDYGNMGCNGGLMDQAFEYVIDNGITTEDKYPYVAVDQDCKTKEGEFKISSYTDVPAGDCDSLLGAIVKKPVSVAVDALNWQFYSGGIFDDCGDQLDHGVLAVGYDLTGKSKDSQFYKVKNSWGADWGENGYIRIKNGNTCGICNAASYAQ